MRIKKMGYVLFVAAIASMALGALLIGRAVAFKEDVREQQEAWRDYERRTKGYHD